MPTTTTKMANSESWQRSMHLRSRIHPKNTLQAPADWLIQSKLPSHWEPWKKRTFQKLFTLQEHFPDGMETFHMVWKISMACMPPLSLCIQSWRVNLQTSPAVSLFVPVQKITFDSISSIYATTLLYSEEKQIYVRQLLINTEKADTVLVGFCFQITIPALQKCHDTPPHI